MQGVVFIKTPPDPLKLIVPFPVIPFVKNNVDEEVTFNRVLILTAAPILAVPAVTMILGVDELPCILMLLVEGEGVIV